MNRDTLYAAAVVDTEGGRNHYHPRIPRRSLLFGDPSVIDNDHYAPVVVLQTGDLRDFRQIPSTSPWCSAFNL